MSLSPHPYDQQTASTDGIPNVDPAEMARFNALASRWWDADSEFWPLHRLNPSRLEWINELSPLQGKAVLDVGCGGGILSEAMARKDAHVTGIDIATKALQIARLHAQQTGVKATYALSTAEEWAQQHAAQYDTVTCMEMLEHVPDPAAVVQACAHLAKPGGWVFFSTINRSLLGYLKVILAAEYILRILPIGTHSYAKFIRPAELVTMCTAAELQLHEARGMGFNPITRQFSLTRNTASSYLLALRKPM